MHQISCSSIQSSTHYSGKQGRGHQKSWCLALSQYHIMQMLHDTSPWVLHCRIATPALVQLIRGECIDSEDADLESTWKAGGTVWSLHGSCLSRGTMDPLFPMHMGFPTPSSLPASPEAELTCAGHRKRFYRLCRWAAVFCLIFPVLWRQDAKAPSIASTKTRNVLTLTSVVKDSTLTKPQKNCCNLTLSLPLQVYITLSCKILRVCTLFIFLKQISKKMEG